MRRAVYWRLVSIILVTVSICILGSALIFSIKTQNITQEWITTICESMSRLYQSDHPAQEQAEYLSDLIDGDRVTLIAADGTVLADSEANAQEMDNHLSRQEIEDALFSDQIEVQIRTSDTTGRHLMYAAMRLPDGNVLRVAHEYPDFWDNFLSQVPGLTLLMIPILILAAFLARSFSAKVLQPMDQVIERLSQNRIEELDQVKTNFSEINQIISSIHKLLSRLERSKHALVLEREKINNILNNMIEGFVLLDENGNVLLLNDSARQIFECRSFEVGEHILLLTRNVKINDAVEKALKEEISSLFDLESSDGKIFSVHISPVQGEYVTQSGRGITVLLVDVTARRKSLQMRQEFFSNASHELKTPITSVQGFIELLNSDLPLDEAERKKILQRVEKETHRMTELMNDILLISRLEGGNREEVLTDISLAEVAAEVIENLQPQADAKQVIVQFFGEDAHLHANPRHIYELLQNLVENAIKYNITGGSVSICVEQQFQKILVSVSDTGIGIPLESQSRVFERFYRVDNGRSKSIGGTGLGLAIVKHIVAKYGGEIQLQSVPNSGTTITVSFSTED